MSYRVHLHPTAERATEVDNLAFIGLRDALLSDAITALLPPSLPSAVWEQMVKRTEPGNSGATATTWLDGRPRRVTCGVLPQVCSRHNAPSRAWAIPRLVRAAAKPGELGLVFALDHADHALATVLATARALPSFKKNKAPPRDAHVHILSPEGPVTELRALHEGAEGVRFAAHLVDMPPNRMNPVVLVETARKLSARFDDVELTVIQGDDVRAEGLGGLWGVGRASAFPPALVILDYAPEDATARVGWLGKGITYDTGGLSLKSKTGMPGMKSDMAGAAAVLAAFVAAVRLGVPQQITAVLAVAENAVGPNATRPDDILEMASGRTVEVNNTDAEGRLVLADGAAWVVRNRELDVLVDLATLTGAQPMATGKLHAALYCSDAALEARAVQVGQRVGELVHPLPYAPELFKKEFSSSVADMRNSVKDRYNAQSSCAGQFIANHLGSYTGPWLHVDMAGPSLSLGRGSGWGVGLLLGLLGVGGINAR